MRRRIATHRRIGAGLSLEVIDWLLTGDTARPDTRPPGYDPFVPFDDPAPDLRVLWHQHRAQLLDEAARRGIAAPWGLRFEALTSEVALG